MRPKHWVNKLIRLDDSNKVKKRDINQSLINNATRNSTSKTRQRRAHNPKNKPDLFVVKYLLLFNRGKQTLTKLFTVKEMGVVTGSANHRYLPSQLTTTRQCKLMEHVVVQWVDRYYLWRTLITRIRFHSCSCFRGNCYKNALWRQSTSYGF